MIEIDLLRQLLRYEPETGLLFWKDRPAAMFNGPRDQSHSAANWNARHGGKLAFTARARGGYYQGSLHNRMYRAHRVVWALHYGEWPVDHIDHINGDTADNRIQNLREVSNAENARNAKRYATNTSGEMGVYWSKALQKWRVQIQAQAKLTHIGYFDNFDEAVAARKSAEARHNYHANHGRVTG